MFGSAKKERERLEKIADLENVFHAEMRPRSTFAVTLPLAEPTLIERRRVAQVVREAVEAADGSFAEHRVNEVIDGLQKEPSLLSIGKPGPEFQLFAFEVAGVGVTVVLAPVRIKDIEGMATFFAPNDWETQGREIKRHKAHVAIYDTGFAAGPAGSGAPQGRDAAFNKAAAVTSVAAALGAELGALGVCWHKASNGLKPEGLATARDQLARGHAPIDLWIRVYRTLANPGEHPGVITSGLDPFVGFELEFVSSPTDVRIAQNFIRDLAVDLLDRDAVLAEGEVVVKGEEAARMELAEENGQKICRFDFCDPWDA